MGHAKRDANRTVENLSKENVDARVVDNDKATHRTIGSREKISSSRCQDSASPRVKQFARDLHIFCAARKYYTPEVEGRFERLEEIIRQGTSNDRILAGIEDIVDAIVSDGLRNDNQARGYWLTLRRLIAWLRGMM